MSIESEPDPEPAREPRVAAALLLVANVLFFWPVLFHGRVFSSHGAALSVFPWKAASRVDDPRVRLLADPASAGAPLLRDLPAKVFWNRSTAGGSPGAINVVEGLLSPLSWLPAILLPEPAIETGILFLKLNAGFLFLFLFLRGRGLPEAAAACGAAAWGWSVAQSAWWLWMQSSVTICFPLLLLAADRARLARRFDSAVAAAALAFLAFLSGGYPFMLLFGAAAALAYAAGEAGGRPVRESCRAAGRLAAAALLAAAILAPAFRLSARTIRASGQVPARAGLAREMRLPLRHALLYAFPLAFGDPLRGDYRPLTASRFDTFLETAVGVGPVAIGLALLGAASRRHRRLWVYGAALAAGTAAVLYVPSIRGAFETLPVLSAGLLERVKILAVFGLAIAAAAGADVAGRALENRPRLGRAAKILPFLVGVPLILVAARIYPAVLPRDAAFTETPGLRALARERGAGPSRFLATGWTLYPDLGQAFGLEDVRGHLFFEKSYRRLLSAADPGIYGRTGTLLISDPRTLDPASPILDLLGVSAIAAAPGTAEPAGGALRETYGGPDLAVFRRPTAFPRFFLATKWQPGGIDAVARASRDALRETAFVDPEDAVLVPPGIVPRGPEGSVVVEAYGDDSFGLRVRTASPALLVSSQKLFPPYWTARLDGVAAAPLRVDGLFFGLPVPAGDHVVEGRFRIPAGEVAVSALAALAVAAMAATSALARRRVP